MLNVGTLTAILRLNDADFQRGMRGVGSSVRSSAKTVAKELAVAGTAVAGLGTLSVKLASDFESSFAGVRKTVNATEEEFAALSAGFRQMAREIPVNVNELNRIGEAAGQLGIKTENILSFTRTMADLGVTTNLSADQAATALARLANITGLPQDQIDRLGSTIVALGNNFATTESEIVEFGTRMAGAGEIAGLTEAQILAIGAAMSSVGVEAEAGGTAVQKVLLGMTQAVAEGSDALDVFASTAGMSAEEFASAWREDAGAAFTAFVEGLGQQGEDAFQTLEALDLQDQRLIRSFLSLSGAGDLLAQTMRTGTDAFRDNTALAKEAAQRYETFASQMTLLKNTLQDVGISIGQMLIPIILEVKDILFELAGDRGAQSVVDQFATHLPNAVSKTVDAFVFVSRGITGLQLIWLGAIEGIKQAWDGLVFALRASVAWIIEKMQGLSDILVGLGAITGETANAIRDFGTAQDVLANQNMDNVIRRSDEMRKKYEELLDSQRNLERHAETYKDRLVEVATEAANAARSTGVLREQVLAAAPAVEAFADSAGSVTEQLLDGAPAAQNLGAMIWGLPPVYDAATAANERFTLGIRTGIAAIDSWIAKAEGIVDAVFKIVGAFKGGGGGFDIGSLFGGAQGAFGGGQTVGGAIDTGIFSHLGEQGATGFLGKMQSILGNVSSWLPVVGPLLTAFGGPLLKGLKALGGKIWGALKGLFGGPSAEELAGRDARSQFSSMVAGLLDATQQAEVFAAVSNGASEHWAQMMVLIRDSKLAMGGTVAEAEAAVNAIIAAEKQGPEAVAAAIAAIQPIIDQAQQAARDAGQSLTEYRDSVINAAQDAANAVAESTTRSVEEVRDMAFAAADSISESFRNIEGIKGLGNFGPVSATTRLEGFQTHPGQTRIVPGSPNQGRLAVVHGGERISRPGGGGQITIPIYMDGKLVAKEVVKITPEIASLLGVG